MPEIFVFGGCNGSGKTTLANNFLSSAPNIEYVNAEHEANASLVVEDDDLRVRAALQHNLIHLMLR